MTNNGRWKTILAYAAGIVILTVSVILAWFLPEWYGQWQDQRLMGNVTLSNRENIEFIDSDSLDIAGRMKMLAEGEELSWSGYTYLEEGYVYWGGEMYDTGVLQNYENIVARCRKVMEQWWTYGLLPVDNRSWIDMQHLVLLTEQRILVDHTLLPVYCMVYTKDMVDEITDDFMVVIMDREKELVYYNAINSPETREYMAQELGYDSLNHLRLELQEWTDPKSEVIDIEQFDFAAVCGAETAEISCEAGKLELTAKLEFENFEGYAGRSVWAIFGDNIGFGLVTWLGTPMWNELMLPMYEEFGWGSYAADTETWLTSIRDDILVHEEPYVEKYDAVSESAVY